MSWQRYSAAHSMEARSPSVSPEDGPLAQRLAIIREDHDRKHQQMDGVSYGWCWRVGRERSIPNTVKCDIGLVLLALAAAERVAGPDAAHPGQDPDAAHPGQDPDLAP